MKKEAFAWVAGVALCVVGCVSTVTEPTPGRMPAYRDRVERRFDRPLNEVFEASKRALNSYGNITAESAFATSTNQVRTLSGSVNQAKVWMRIEAVKASVTSVTVQMRAALGGTDLAMAQELENRIALELSP
jgi:hypothetical protein